MDYKTFCAAWNEALAASGLRSMGPPRESLDLERMERCYEVFVEPVAGQGPMIRLDRTSCSSAHDCGLRRMRGWSVWITSACAEAEGQLRQ
jgi:hypothetical protein